MRVGSFNEASKGQKPLHCTSAEQVEDAPIGRVVERWGWCAQVDEDFVRPSTFEKHWRQRGDPKADAVVRFLGLGPGKDSLHAIDAYIEERPREEWHQSIRDFVDEMWRAPPDSIAAQRMGPDGKPVFSSAEAIREDSRRPSPSPDQGQAVFWRYGLEIATALLHGSLAAGFTAPRLLSTLNDTGYLTGNNRDATWRRLLETHQMVLDAMRDMTPVTSIGWRSVVRVRLLHATVRVRILEGRGARKEYSVERDGIPINQEDLAATLAAFAVVPLWACRRYHTGLTTEEEAAYIAAWRHIGYYLGIEVPFLERHFGRSISTAEKFTATSAWHLFQTADPPPGLDPTETATMRVLRAISSRPPQPSSPDVHVETARITLGHGLADRLLLPPVSLKVKAMARWRLFCILVLTRFGRYYPRRSWQLRRILMLQRIQVAMTAWQLGSTRTRFVPKRDDQQSEPDYKKTGDGEEVDVVLGIQAGKAVRKEYKSLIREMLAVIVVSAVALAASSFFAARLAVRLL